MIMEFEKRRSKGSFLSFFDWNGKSRKKLFCDNPNLPEVSKQGKENMENMPKSQLNRIKVEDSGSNPSNIASCDVNCALSINSDGGCGTKAPGLVARLMGLDSLPASTVSELSSTSLYGSNSLGSSLCHEDEGALHLMADYCPMDYINMPLKLEKSSSVSMESNAQKVGNLTMKRFQTEMLPPKSAKPIPVTHNKLLSPIKSPGYIAPKNAAHIMEAAAKIIEASPQPYMRNRLSSVGPSSVPLRILDLKEELEAAQGQSCTANPVTGKPSERSNNLYKSISTFKGSRDSEKNGSRHLASKGKPVSLAIPSKSYVQGRDALISNSNRGYMKPKEQNEIKQNQLSRSQKNPITDRARGMQQRACTGQNSNVSGQNNQKQNSVTNKGKSTSKMDSNKPTGTWSSESSTGAWKTTNKGAASANMEPKRSSTRESDSHTQKEFPVSRRKSISQKKRYINRDVQNEARGPNNAVNNHESKSIKCLISTDGSIDQDTYNMKESKDVISFTFTSPLRRNMPESQSSTEQVMETRNRIDVHFLGHSDKLYPKNLSSSLTGLDILDNDALSVLLEKKLQELTCRINPPQYTLATEGLSAGLRSSLEDNFHSLVSTTAREHDISFFPGLLSNKLDDMHDNDCSSSDNLVLNMYQQQQTSEPMEGPSCSSSGESRNDLGSSHSRAVKVFEDPFVSESYLDSEDSSTYGSTVYSSMQSEEVSNFSPINEYVSLENEAKWSEKSSSTVVEGNMAIEQLSGLSILVDFPKSTRNMELEYVKDILSNAELMAEEFVVGHTDKVIMPNLFDVLENQSNGAENYKEYSKLERKVLFDSLSECLELRCKQAFVGRCKAWPRWVASVQRKSWLAEELYKEMMGFRSMEEEVMVDELVSKDMSNGWGRWIDFNIEAFEEGLDVELDIVTYLIHELVSDLLLV